MLLVYEVQKEQVCVMVSPHPYRAWDGGDQPDELGSRIVSCFPAYL